MHRKIYPRPWHCRLDTTFTSPAPFLYRCSDNVILPVQVAVLVLAALGKFSLWAAVAVDVGTALLVIANGMTLLRWSGARDACAAKSGCRRAGANSGDGCCAKTGCGAPAARSGCGAGATSGDGCCANTGCDAAAARSGCGVGATSGDGCCTNTGRGACAAKPGCGAPAAKSGCSAGAKSSKAADGCCSSGSKSHAHSPAAARCTPRSADEHCCSSTPSRHQDGSETGDGACHSHTHHRYHTPERHHSHLAEQDSTDCTQPAASAAVEMKTSSCCSSFSTGHCGGSTPGTATHDHVPSAHAAGAAAASCAAPVADISGAGCCSGHAHAHAHARGVPAGAGSPPRSCSSPALLGASPGGCCHALASQKPGSLCKSPGKHCML